MSKDRSKDDDNIPPVRGNFRDPNAPPPPTSNQVIVSVQTPPGIPFTVIINGRIIDP